MSSPVRYALGVRDRVIRSVLGRDLYQQEYGFAGDDEESEDAYLDMALGMPVYQVHNELTRMQNVVHGTAVMIDARPAEPVEDYLLLVPTEPNKQAMRALDMLLGL